MEWETVWTSPYREEQLHKMKVDGGWLYKYAIKDTVGGSVVPPIISMTFVPEIPAL